MALVGHDTPRSLLDTLLKGTQILLGLGRRKFCDVVAVLYLGSTTVPLPGTLRKIQPRAKLSNSNGLARVLSAK